MSRFIWAATAALVLQLASAGGASAACDRTAERKFVCGVTNSEDIIHLPQTDWVIAGGMNGPGAPHGWIYAVGVTDRSVRALYPLATSRREQDRSQFPNCPAAPEDDRFVAHGLAVRRTGAGRFILYAVNHGGRESIEVFAVAVERSAPQITWIGCALLPKISAPGSDVPAPAIGNSVTPLPDGAFAVTVTPKLDPTDPKIREKIDAGDIQGKVLIWRPKTGWEEVPGGELAGDNGVEASADGGVLYVNASGEKAIHRLPLRPGAAEPAVLKTGIHVDNIRWGDDGFLYVAGATTSMKAILDCAFSAALVCSNGFKVLKVDPASLQAEEVVNSPGSPEFGLATTGVRIGSEIWASSYRSDRLAIFPAK